MFDTENAPNPVLPGQIPTPTPTPSWLAGTGNAPIIPPQQPAAEVPAPDMSSFAERLKSAADNLGIAPGVGGWARSLVASAVAALPTRPAAVQGQSQSQPAQQQTQPAQQQTQPAQQQSQPTRAQQIAQGVQGGVNAIAGSLGDAGAIGAVPAGAGAFYGLSKTLAGRSERLDHEQMERATMAESNARMVHEQALTHQLGEQQIQTSIDAGNQAVNKLKTAASPAAVIADGVTSDEFQQLLATGKIDATR